MTFSPEIMRLLSAASELANTLRHEFVTPEHLIHVLCTGSGPFIRALSSVNADVPALEARVHSYLAEDLETVPDNVNYELYSSAQLTEAYTEAQTIASHAGSAMVDLAHFVSAILSLRESAAASMLTESIGSAVGAFLAALVSEMASAGADGGVDTSSLVQFGEVIAVDRSARIVGRKTELGRMTRALCRMECNNVLLVGEHGVGKTALVLELARLSEMSKLPRRLNRLRFLEVDMAALMVGTEMRGALDRNVASLVERVSGEGDVVVVMENFASMFSSSNSSSKEDPLAVLSPYLQSCDVPFVMTATFSDMKRIQQKGSAVESLFEVIEVGEMTREDTIKVMKDRIQECFHFHNVDFDESIAPAIVDLSVSHSKGVLPAKALRLMDDIGAWAESHRKKFRKSVEASDLDMIVSEITGKAVTGAAETKLSGLSDRIKKYLFGQDKAVDALCTSLLIAKAGLSNPVKPLGSFLFIGPTGVGKTQLAKTLSDQLGQPLVRFDMSEYAEKHTVSKFIGSPAGYVGYDDGGLLTDAVRKNPGCVLLLDEIEKAHQDIYNLLLQIMDYGTLTDSKGQKADFRGVVLIMTSNAGARFANQASVGFGKVAQPGAVMEGEARKVFAPEFLNRLSSVVVFNALDRSMAAQVLDAKLDELSERLKARKVRLTVSKAAHDALLDEGFSPEYGAREMERVIDSRIKPVLVNEILFGKLKDGGRATLDYTQDKTYTVTAK